MALADIKQAARLRLHAHNAVPAQYLAPGATTPVECSVRVLDVDTLSGWDDAARRWMESPKLVFLVSQVSPARGGRVTITGSGESYRIENVMPEYNVTVTAETIRL